MSERKAAEAFPPASYIREELRARGWLECDLAEQMGEALAVVEGLLRGDLRINDRLAGKLSACFDTSTQLWLNLEATWQAGKARGAPRGPATPPDPVASSTVAPCGPNGD